jgi:RNA polymerase subunit RPABC4/transcription elongation factor Spt4
MPDLGGLWTAFVNNPIIQYGVRFAGVYVLFLYLATVFWTIRDAQQRTENRILPYLAGLLVVATWVLGLFVYMIVRSKETLAESYERQLAEESLLAEAEQRLVCPTCRERVQDDYILCPTCRTRLKRVCPSCAKLIRPEWNICPFCAKDFDERDWTVHAGGKSAPAAAGKSPTVANAAVRDVTEKISNT